MKDKSEDTFITKAVLHFYFAPGNQVRRHILHKDFRREAREEKYLGSFICARVREWEELLCNVNSLNSSLFVLLGG